jgi:hypothetical protein
VGFSLAHASVLSASSIDEASRRASNQVLSCSALPSVVRRAGGGDEGPNYWVNSSSAEVTVTARSVQMFSTSRSVQLSILSR